MRHVVFIMPGSYQLMMMMTAFTPNVHNLWSTWSQRYYWMPEYALCGRVCRNESSERS